MLHKYATQLPARLWSFILLDVDDLILWSSCRRVSKMLRAEAKRQFATQRSRELRIHWDASDLRRLVGEQASYTFFATTKIQFIDNIRATFSVNIRNQTVDPNLEPGMNCRSGPLDMYRLMHRLLSNNDHNSYVFQREGCKSDFEGEAERNVLEALYRCLPRREDIS